MFFFVFLAALLPKTFPLYDLLTNKISAAGFFALGAAYLAGLAVGYWSSKEDVINNWAIDRTFEPSITEEERIARCKGWSKAVKCSYGWAKED